jgi:LytR cell envelope-related transcriptional attenuator
MDPVFALSVEGPLKDIGALAGLVAIPGLAILSLLYFAQAREVKRLREWAGRAPERAQELQDRVAEQAARTGTIPPQPARVTAQPLARPGGGATPAPQPGQPASRPATPAAAPSAMAAGVAAKPGSAPPPAVGSQPAATPGSQPAAKPGTQPAATPGSQPAAKPGTQPAAQPEARPAPASAGAVAPNPGEKPAAKAQATGTAPTAKPATPPAATPGAGASATSAKPAPPASGEGNASGASAPSPAGSAPNAGAAGSGRTTAREPSRAQPLRSSRPSAAASGTPQRRARARGSRLGRRGAAIISAVILVLVVGALVILTQDGGGSKARPQAQNTLAPASQTARPKSKAKSTQPAVQRASTAVAVLNGTTTPGLAATVSDDLSRGGFKRGNVTNAADQQQAQTAVAYAPGFKRAADEVAQILKLKAVTPIDPGTQAIAGSDAQVVVTVGTDRTR